ncbi:MAG: nodulation protein NodZ [Cyanobacteria bacterium J06648_16]
MSKKYIVLKGYAGLGNRISALVTAILYAKLSGRTLVVDWRDGFYSSDGSNVFDALFQIQNIPTAAPFDRADSVAPKIWQNRLNLNLPDFLAKEAPSIRQTGQRMFMKYSINIGKLTYPQDCLIYCSYVEEISQLKRYLTRDLAHLKRAANEAIFAEVFTTHLKLAPAINRYVTDFISAHFTKQPVIGFHVRHTDKPISLSRYRRAFKEHLEKYPNAIFFLATDNRAVEQQFLAEYPQKIVVTEKWLPEDGSKAHGNQNCPSLAQHAVESLIDIVLLSRCDRLIYSRTTSFAQIARMVSLTLSSDRCFDIQTYEDQRHRSWQERRSSMSQALQRRIQKLQAVSKMLRP